MGVILYELLVGRTPFSRQPTLAILQSQLNDLPVPPSRCAPMAVPAYLDKAVLRALEKRPADRFMNAAAFAAALDPKNSRESLSEGGQTCSHCKFTNSNSFKFCPECGTPKSAPQAFQVRFNKNGNKADRAEPSPSDVPDLDLPHATTTKVPTQDVRQALALAKLEEKGDLFPLPIVGRDEELRVLRKLLSSEDPGTIQIRGLRGSGCTRLLFDTCQEAGAQDCAVFLAQADPTGQASSLYPIRAMVAAILRLESSCTYVDVREALMDMGLGANDLPGIGELFQQAGSGLWELETTVRRREVFAATISLLRSVGESYGAVLAFEDCHLYDGPSLDLVQQLCAGNMRSPALRIIASSDLGESSLLESETHLDLAPLNKEAFTLLVAHIESRAAEGLVTMNDLRSSDTPAHLGQLVHYAVEGGDLQQRPEGLGDLLAARIDLLPQVAKRVLQAAAVFGLQVDEADLVAALASSVGRIEMDASLKLLGSRNFLRIDLGMIRFETSMVRDVIYEATPHDVRCSMHAAAGDVLKATTSDPGVLGLHAERSGDLWRASEFLLLAGKDSVKHFDDRGAVTALQRALNAIRALLQADPDSQTQFQFVDISIELSSALQSIGEFGLAKGILSECWGHCRDFHPLHIRLQRASAKLKAANGDIQAAVNGCREAISMSMRIFEREQLTESYLDLAAMLQRCGESLAAVRELEEGIDIITAGEGPTIANAPVQFWRLLLRLGQLLAAEGEDSKARGIVANAMRLAKENDSALGVARANMTLASILDSAGDATRAQQHRELAIDEMRALGDRRTTAELVLAGTRASEKHERSTRAETAEAQHLAAKVTWDSGVPKAKHADIVRD